MFIAILYCTLRQMYAIGMRASDPVLRLLWTGHPHTLPVWRD